MSMDSGMIVVIMISMMYMVLVFGLLFYVKNEWCDLLFKNFTVMFQTVAEMLGVKMFYSALLHLTYLVMELILIGLNRPDKNRQKLHNY